MNDNEQFSDKHVVLLINYLRRHHVLTLREFSKRVGKLTVLVSTPMEGDRAWEPEWDDLNVVVQTNSTITLRRNAGFDEKNFVHIPWDTVATLRRLKPDIIFSYEMGMRTLFCCLHRLVFRNVPLVMVGNMSNHIESNRGILRRSIRHLIKAGVDYSSYNGPSCKNYLESLGITQDRLFHFPYCFDRKKTFSGTKTFSEGNSKKLVYCGSLNERKSILETANVIAECCKEFPNDRFKLTIAGEGPDRAKLESLKFENLELSLLGNVGPEQLGQCYGEADICVFPTKGDEWGLVPMEAWASGLPVLGSRLSQSVETLCQEGENGWSYDPRDPQQTRNKIHEALNSSTEDLYRMSKIARETVVDYSPSSAADCMCDILRSAFNVDTKKHSNSVARTLTSLANNSSETVGEHNSDRPSNLKAPLRQAATISLDLDNKWAYLKAHNDPNWEALPSYLGYAVPRILSVLDELGMKITFFIVGQDAVVEENRPALRSIADAGHEIANHTFHHEPCLHLYTPDQLQHEFELSEKAIRDATGKKTVGFRGPGFSLSDQTLNLLVKRGYQYDCTTFPTFMAPAARAFYFLSGSFTKQQKKDREALFGKFSDGLLPLDPYVWKAAHGELLELPVSTFPILKTPVHATYLHYLASFSSVAANTYFSAALTGYRLMNISPSFLLHPLDFLGRDDEPELSFFPGMKVDSTTKLARIKTFLQMLQGQFDICPMQKFARISREKYLDEKSIHLARTGIS